MCNAIIGWVRDSKGAVTHRTFNGDICNAITTLVCGGHIGMYGMGNTTPYVLEVFEI